MFILKMSFCHGRLRRFQAIIHELHTKLNYYYKLSIEGRGLTQKFVKYLWRTRIPLYERIQCHYLYKPLERSAIKTRFKHVNTLKYVMYFYFRIIFSFCNTIALVYITIQFVWRCYKNINQFAFLMDQRKVHLIMFFLIYNIKVSSTVFCSLILEFTAVIKQSSCSNSFLQQCFIQSKLALVILLNLHKNKKIERNI